MVGAQQRKGNYKIRISRTKKYAYQLKTFTRWASKQTGDCRNSECEEKSVTVIKFEE